MTNLESRPTSRRRRRRGGITLEQHVAAVYTFDDGKISRIEEFSDVASAHAAA